MVIVHPNHLVALSIVPIVLEYLVSKELVHLAVGAPFVGLERVGALDHVHLVVHHWRQVLTAESVVVPLLEVGIEKKDDRVVLLEQQTLEPILLHQVRHVQLDASHVRDPRRQAHAGHVDATLVIPLDVVAVARPLHAEWQMVGDDDHVVRTVQDRRLLGEHVARMKEMWRNLRFRQVANWTRQGVISEIAAPRWLLQVNWSNVAHKDSQSSLMCDGLLTRAGTSRTFRAWVAFISASEGRSEGQGGSRMVRKGHFGMGEEQVCVCVNFKTGQHRTAALKQARPRGGGAYMTTGKNRATGQQAGRR